MRIDFSLGLGVFFWLCFFFKSFSFFLRGDFYFNTKMAFLPSLLLGSDSKMWIRKAAARLRTHQHPGQVRRGVLFDRCLRGGLGIAY